MSREIEERLRAVERALTDGEASPADVGDRAALRSDLDRQADRIEELDERVRELEAAVQALRGYVGNLRAVNEEVERRADAALAAAERPDGTDEPAPGHRREPRHPVPDPGETDDADDSGLLARVGDWL
jgi:chromosome segregation ATPase